MEIYLTTFALYFIEMLSSFRFMDNYTYSNIIAHRKGHSLKRTLFNESKNSVQLCGMLYVSGYQTVAHVTTMIFMLTWSVSRKYTLFIE